MDFSKVSKETLKLFEEANLIESFSKVYAENFGVDEELAKKIVKAKFDKHINESVKNFSRINNLKDAASYANKNVSIDDFLKDKKVVKG